jgi:hypothetical protein
MGPEGSGRLRLPDSVTSALESGRLSAIPTGRLYPPRNPGHMELSDTTKKIPNDTTGDRSRDPPTSSHYATPVPCYAVPLPFLFKFTMSVSMHHTYLHLHSDLTRRTKGCLRTFQKICSFGDKYFHFTSKPAKWTLHVSD